MLESVGRSIQHMLDYWGLKAKLITPDEFDWDVDKCIAELQQQEEDGGEGLSSVKLIQINQ